VSASKLSEAPRTLSSVELSFHLIRFVEPPPEGFRLAGRVLVKRWNEDGELIDQCEIFARLPEWILRITHDTVEPDLPPWAFERAVESRASGRYPREARFECLKYGGGILDLLAAPDPNRKTLDELFGLVPAPAR
jgi:hypothetical protein